MKRNLAIAGLAITTAAGAAALATAAIPSPDGVIHSCYSSNGSLKIVDEGTACGPSQTPLNWNQQGPPGEPGLSGVKKVLAQSETNSTGTKSITAFCPEGTRVINGGGASTGGTVALKASQPRADDTGCSSPPRRW